MKKNIIASLIIFSSTAFAYSSDLKGSNYISTDIGASYTYKMTDDTNKDISDNFTIRTTVKSCNQDKTSCNYESTMVDSAGKIVTGSQYEYTYNIKPDGSVYQQTQNIKDDLLFPAKIKFNQVEKYEHAYPDYKVVGSSKFTKQLPEINIENKTYKNCIELEGHSTTTTKEHTIKIDSIEIYCQGIGIVKNVVTQSTDGEKPTTHTNLLSSITKS